MKRMKRVPAAETGRVPGDAKGTRQATYPDGGHNPDVGTSGRGGIAPVPSGGAAMLGNDRPTRPAQSSMARVANAGGAPQAGNFLPVQNNAMANLVGQSTGQSEVAPRGPGIRVDPQTKTPVTGNPVASNKPRRKGLGAAFYGEYRGQ